MKVAKLLTIADNEIVNNRLTIIVRIIIFPI